jgi:mannose-6-phosphate isomerase-like protein (cupin superfamily)
MTAWQTRHQGPAPEPEELERKLKEDGLDPHWWENSPGDTYGWHSHDYHKVLFCTTGSIIFHTGEGDFELRPGDRFDVEPGTEHAATVGPDGVRCVESAR